jgi:hypothetical protein
MKDTSSDDAKSLAAHVIEAREEIGDRLKSATAAIAAAAGHAQKLVADATAATAAAAGHANKVLGDAGETARRLGRKRAKWRRRSLMRVVARPDRFRGRSARIH